MTDDELKQIMAEEGLTDSEIAEAFTDICNGAPDRADMKQGEKPKARHIRIEVEARPGEEAKAIAQAMLRPSTKAAAALLSWSARDAFAEVDYMEVVRDLQAQSAAVNKNDLTRLEAMLVSQANTLDTLYYELLRRAASNISQHPLAFERYMKLAFKAQSQCRVSVEALAEMKNPKPVFVGQNNIATNQQVNNQPRAREEKSKSANELLEHQREEWLDTRATGSTGRTDSDLATVVPIHRPADLEREGSSEPELVQARSAQS